MLRSLTTMQVMRLRIGMTQSILAREVKSQQTTISLIERRQIAMPEDLGKKIGKILDLHPDELLEDYDEYVLRTRGAGAA